MAATNTNAKTKDEDLSPTLQDFISDLLESASTQKTEPVFPIAKRMHKKIVNRIDKEFNILHEHMVTVVETADCPILRSEADLLGNVIATNLEVIDTLLQRTAMMYGDIIENHKHE